MRTAIYQKFGGKWKESGRIPGFSVLPRPGDCIDVGSPSKTRVMKIKEVVFMNDGLDEMIAFYVEDLEQ